MTKEEKVRAAPIYIGLLLLLWSYAALAADEQSAKDGFKQIHQGMKKVTRTVDKNAKKGFKTVHKRAKKDVKTIDKSAKKGWNQIGQSIKKAGQ
jgi:hypothetical protein